MKLGKRHVTMIVGIPIMVLVVVAVLLGWIWLSREILEHPLAKGLPVPVLCSSRGCLTSTLWQRHWRAQVAFAQKADAELPTPEEALTSAARQHLVRHAMVRTAVTIEDARRYRAEILKMTDEEAVVRATGLTLEEYDDFVMLPLLEQEVLRQQLRVESVDELFQLLAKDRPMWALPEYLKWDQENARVVGN